MDTAQAAEWFRQQLTAVGFVADQPDPALVWAVFKRFAIEPLTARTTEVWFEAADGNSKSGSYAYFDFVRMVMHTSDEGTEWGEQITAHFTAPPEARPGLGHPAAIHAEDVALLEPWFAAVEASPAFRAGCSFTGWSFEVRIDGC